MTENSPAASARCAGVALFASITLVVGTGLGMEAGAAEAFAEPGTGPHLAARGGGTPFACDGERVYWVADGAIRVMGPSADDGETVAAVGGLTVTHLLADAQGVVVAGTPRGGPSGVLYSLGQSGGARVELARGDWEVQAVSADSENVYWLALPKDDDGRGDLHAVARGGGPSRTLATALRFPWDLAVDSVSVFFTTAGSAFARPLGPPDGTVGRVDKKGGRVRILYARQYGPGNLAVSATHIFWSDDMAVRGERARSGIWRGRKGGGKARRLAEVDDVVGDLVVCGEALVLSIPGNARTEGERLSAPRGTIRRLPLAGGRVQPVSDAVFRRPMQLAVGRDLLWWSDGEGLWRQPRAEACALTSSRPRPAGSHQGR